MEQTSKHVFELIILNTTAQISLPLNTGKVEEHFADDIVQTHLRVSDYTGFKCIQQAIYLRLFGLTSKKRFYLRNVRNGDLIPFFQRTSDFTIAPVLGVNPDLNRLFQ